MISLICFEDELVITKEEAEKLNLKYKFPKKLGYSYHYEKLMEMQSYHYYKEDCIEKDGKYYKDEKAVEKDDSIGSYYLFRKVENIYEYVVIPKDNNLVDLMLFAPMCKYKFFIKESILTKEPTVNNITALLMQLEEKATFIDGLVDKIKNNTFNAKTNVHVGGGLIATYNDLLLKKDACTDDLQRELNNGWRIIAVCVQPDGRRPDYILGRYNPKLEVAEKESAGR